MRVWLNFFTTMIVASLGAVLANWMGVVGGWLIGALIATLVAGRLGLPIGMPWAVRSVALAFAGIMTGATITAETMGTAAELSWTVAGLLLLTLAVMISSYFAHRLIWGSSEPTAFYSSWPGNTILAFVAAEKSKADLDRVVFVQSARLIILVVLLPLMISAFHPVVRPDTGRFDLQLAIAAVSALPFMWLATRWRILGGEMFFTAIFIGALTYAGVLKVAIPAVAIDFFQVIVGAFIAINLARCNMASLRAAAWPAAVGATIGGLLTFAFALPIAGWLDINPAALILAYAPGGAEPMILLSSVFGVDPGFVGIHHTIRLIGLTMVFPLLARFVGPSMGQ